MKYKLKESEILYRGKVFDLRVDKIEYDSGNPAIREVAVHPGGAVTVPVTDNGKIVLVKQFRYPFGENMLEFPAGKLDPDEDPSVCAKRELAEETGYTAGNLTKLGVIRTAPGYLTEVLFIFLAAGLSPGKHNREEGESTMEVFELTPDEIKDKIENGQITDSKTICGFYFYLKYLKKL